MKVIDKILKGLLLFWTAIFGIFFNIFGGIAMIVQNTDINEQVVQIGIAMLIINAVCYVAGTVLVMLRLSIIASALSVLGTGGMLVLYGLFSQFTLENNVNASELFMNHHLPSILITVITLIIMVLENYQRWSQKSHAKAAKQLAPSPSILGGEYVAEEAQKPKKQRDNTKKDKNGTLPEIDEQSENANV